MNDLHPNRPRSLLAPALLIMIATGGCTHRVAVEPIKIEPIYITLDVNLKVDRALDDFFDFQDEVPPVPPPPSETPAPSGAPS